MGNVLSSFKTKVDSVEKKSKSEQKSSKIQKKIEIKERLEAIEEKRRLTRELDSYHL
tara:strand:- start:547 stop:717 length:171 start_codon:yes stop_codon:yes gene_type:complete